jgi:hypothetical protein
MVRQSFELLQIVLWGGETVVILAYLKLVYHIHLQVTG